MNGRQNEEIDSVVLWYLLRKEGWGPVEEFTLGELRAMEGALNDTYKLLERAGRLAPRMQYRKQNAATALKKIREEIAIRRILKAG